MLQQFVNTLQITLNERTLQFWRDDFKVGAKRL